MSVINTSCGDQVFAQGLSFNSTTGALTIYPEGNSVNLIDLVKNNETVSIIESFTLIGTTLSITFRGEDGISITKSVSLASIAGGSFSLVGITPLIYNSGTQQISIQEATASQSGYLSATNFIGFSGKLNTLSNIGSGIGVFKQKTGTNGEFKSLVAGANVVITQNPNEIVIESSAAGEINTAANIGLSGGEIFKQKNGTEFEFRRIIEGPGIVITQDADNLTIESVATGGSDLLYGTLL